MRTLIIILAGAIALAASCDQTQGTQMQSKLTGKWKFTEFLQDPGDGSGKWAPAPTAETYIEFRTDSTISTDVSQLQGYTRYSKITKDEIVMSQSGNNVTFKYTLKGSNLEIRPPCREACGLRFTK